MSALYTPEVLAAAVGLSAWPWDDALLLQGEARSRTCGSHLALGLDLDAAGAIARLGIKAHACAIGQAAAHVFAGGAAGRTRDDVAAARVAIGAWLAGEGDLPDWPGFGMIAPALPHRSRHGAIVLAWDAALEALDRP